MTEPARGQMEQWLTDRVVAMYREGSLIADAALDAPLVLAFARQQDQLMATIERDRDFLAEQIAALEAQKAALVAALGEELADHHISPPACTTEKRDRHIALFRAALAATGKEVTGLSASWPFKDANGKPDYNIVVSEEEMTELESIIGPTTPDDKLDALMAAVEAYACLSVPYLIIDDGVDADGDKMWHSEPDPTGPKQFADSQAAVRAAAVAYGDARVTAKLTAIENSASVRSSDGAFVIIAAETWDAELRQEAGA